MRFSWLGFLRGCLLVAKRPGGLANDTVGAGPDSNSGAVTAIGDRVLAMCNLEEVPIFSIVEIVCRQSSRFHGGRLAVASARSRCVAPKQIAAVRRQDGLPIQQADRSRSRSDCGHDKSLKSSVVSQFFSPCCTLRG